MYVVCNNNINSMLKTKRRNLKKHSNQKYIYNIGITMISSNVILQTQLFLTQTVLIPPR